MSLLFADKPAIASSDCDNFRRRWFGDFGGKMIVVVGFLVLLHILYVIFHWGGEENKALISNIASIVVYLVTALYTWRTSRHRSLSKRSQRAWKFIALGNAAFLGGSILWTYFENYLGEQPFPSLADFGYLAYFPLMMAGLLLLVEPMKSAEARLGFALDIAIIMIGVSLVMWFFLLQPLVAAGDGFTLVTVLSVAYPVGDLVLMFGMVTILLRRSTFGDSIPVTLVLIGLAGNFAADFIFGYQTLKGTFVSGDWVDALWTIGCLPIVIGAHYRTLQEPVEDQQSDPASDQSQSRFVSLPYIAVACAYLILILAEFDDAISVHGADILIAGVLTALIVLRQIMFLRENSRAKNKLTELQERIQGIYAASSDGIGIADLNGNLLEVNDAFVRLTGYDRKPLKPDSSTLDLTIDLDRSETTRIARKVLATQKPVEYEKDYVRKDGSSFVAQITVFPVRSPLGTPSALAAVIRDITERKRAQDALRSSEEQHRLLFENNPFPAYVYDLETLEFLAVNEAAVKQYGYSREEFLGGLTLIDIRPEEDVPEFLDRVAKVSEEHSTMAAPSRHAKKDGTVTQVEITSHVVTFDGRRAEIVLVNDITDRLAAEEQLRMFNQKLQQSNRELQDFAYIASHDLQEPLRKVQTFADRLGTKYSDALDETGRDYLERMRNAAARMQTLIQDLLAFSRVTTKAQPFIQVDLEKITREVLSDLEVTIEETGAVVETDNLPVVDADPSQMRQLIQNLVGNALKFRREGAAPHVRISARPLDNGSTGNYRVTVEDNGIGFDEKYLEKIFTVFQRLHGRTEFEGSGIGLAVCRKIVERHHGEITARSAPGDGAKFIFTLPAHHAAAERS